MANENGLKMLPHFLVHLGLLALSNNLLVSSSTVPRLETSESCFCEAGCYMNDFRLICCDEICLHAEERSTKWECEQRCPHYKHVHQIEQKCNDLVVSMRLHIEELEKKLDELLKKHAINEAEEEAGTTDQEREIIKLES